MGNGPVRYIILGSWYQLPQSPHYPRIHFPLCTLVSILQETCEHPVLSCPVFCIFVPCTLPDYPKISQGLLFISVFFTVPFAAPDLSWCSVEFFLIEASGQKFEIWAIPKHFRKTQEKKKKKKESHSQQIHFSRSPLCSWKQF